MRTIILISLLTVFSLTGIAQLESRKEVKIPDIPGYMTLKCDFHMHTIFSDGLVWPTVRVDEAWREGLDVIAISDHYEYTPFEDDVDIKFGRAYEIAKPRADMYGLIIIKAGEITRKMPPGHYNCLFLKDVAALDKPDFWDAINEAVRQDAFIMWNHPGWLQKNELPIWYEEQTRLYKEGHLHGMELVNERSFYPLALQWCVEKNITMLGSSDIHSPTGMFYDLSLNDHRTMTLVFATAKTEAAVREALFSGRTAVYTGEMLAGKEEFLMQIFQNSIEVVNHDADFASEDTYNIQIANRSEIPFKLVSAEQPKGVEYPEEITLYPERTVFIQIKVSRQALNNPAGIKLPYVVKNLYINKDTGLPVEIDIPVAQMK
jgi:3',5'-nucleoside bisphosphate phosphatase